MEQQKRYRILGKQLILCPWVSSQPYNYSPQNRNRALTQNTYSNRFLNNFKMNKQKRLGMPWSQDRPVPSIQQSSSHFFYFLRLMQLFPNIHPATLHTVLVLCNNDFFPTVDKLLYAKKLMCSKKNLVQKKQQNKNFFYGTEGEMTNLITRDFQTCQNNYIIKKQATNVIDIAKKIDEAGPSMTLPEHPDFFGSNLCGENAEDLSVKQSETENSAQV